MTSATWSFTLTLFHIFRIIPLLLMKTVVRLIPINFFPYMLFSPQASYSFNTFVVSSLSRFHLGVLIDSLTREYKLPIIEHKFTPRYVAAPSEDILKDD